MVEIPQVVKFIGIGFSSGLFVLCVGLVYASLRRGISAMSSVD